MPAILLILRGHMAAEATAYRPRSTSTFTSDDPFHPLRACPTPSVVILQPEVRDQVRAHNVPQSILQLHRLDKQIMFRI